MHSNINCIKQPNRRGAGGYGKWTKTRQPRDLADTSCPTAALLSERWPTRATRKRRGWEVSESNDLAGLVVRVIAMTWVFKCVPRLITKKLLSYNPICWQR